MIERRTFLTGLASAFAAPAIVRAASLMPVRGIVMRPPRPLIRYVFRTGLPAAAWRQINEGLPFPRPGLVTFDAYSKEIAAAMFRDWQRISEPVTA